MFDCNFHFLCFVQMNFNEYDKQFFNYIEKIWFCQSELINGTYSSKIVP
jgi:hypothetical protein